jgi:hypothetical protein
MQEVEFTSELLIAIMAGLQDKKSSIENYYKTFDESFTDRASLEHRFRRTIDAINEIIGDDLPKTEFRRVPLFYTLFTCVAHRLFGIPGIALPTPATGKLTSKDGDGLQFAIRELSSVVEVAKEDDGIVADSSRSFVTASIRQTDNLRPRRTRFDAVYSLSFLNA